MSIDRRACGRECLGHTVENPTDEPPSEIRLLGKVQIIWDVWGIRTIGPRVLLRVGHGPGAQEGGIELGRRGS